MISILKKLGIISGLTIAILACNPYQRLEDTVKHNKNPDETHLVRYKDNISLPQHVKTYNIWNFGDSLSILVAEQVKETNYQIPSAIEMKWKNNWGFCDYNKDGLDTVKNDLQYYNDKDYVKDFIWSPQGKYINFSELNKQIQREIKDSIRINVNKVIKGIKK